MNNERISHLLNGYLEGKLTEADEQEFKELLLQEQSTGDLQKALQNLIEHSPALPDYEEAAWDPLYQRITPFPRRSRVVSLLRKKTGVAAAILILLLAGSWVLFSRQRSGKEMARTMEVKNKPANDVAPGSSKAILTLADGSLIDLNAAGNGLVGQQGNSKLVKVSTGQLAYRDDGETGKITNPKVVYNRIATPKGGEYQLILPDGSKVWLNAASSLRYPTTFSGRERVVELKGEAYFEVAHGTMKEGQDRMPFRVHVLPKEEGGEGMDVLVLGTHFNVMAYTDEQSINTTLLEGLVKINRGDRTTLVRPGQQASCSGTDGFKVSAVDTEDAIAWKNGLFRFNEATIEEVMRQVARWYDVEVVYVNGTPPKDLFRGEIYRNVNVSKVLKVLEASGVHFTVEGRKILVQS